MSSNIWTRCEGRSRQGPLGGEAWRVVESQHLFSTRALVDSDAEHQVLEELIEGQKPRGHRGLHFLLATPFRYPPLPHGSRFGTRAEPGIWYGSEEPRTAFAESAYYRLLFLEGTSADLSPLMVEVSAFRAAFKTDRGVDLTRPPFAEHAARISSPVAYEASQRLGRDMRADGVEAFRYRSARDREGGANVALFTPRPFGSRKPGVPETWHCVATPREVEFVKKDVFRRAAFAFPRADFEVQGRLPAPAF
ncbi:MAG TPA: RES family NAD+ phosphorylase [Vicinamibacteria bacterium]|nr:RES family NAD+ phosphorylase [Vicinamibacteria bacterium]